MEESSVEDFPYREKECDRQQRRDSVTVHKVSTWFLFLRLEGGRGGGEKEPLAASPTTTGVVLGENVSTR